MWFLVAFTYFYVRHCMLLYGCGKWTTTKTLEKCLSAFDTWCLQKILRIPYTKHTINVAVRSITGCLPVSDRVKSFRLRFFGFGHLARSAPEEDHHRVIAAALRPPTDWTGGGPLVAHEPLG